MPTGRILEPCRGGCAFTRAMPGCDWCEIQEGKDFLLVSGHWDWIVTNPPWSKFRIFLLKSMLVADNIVFLCLVNAWFMKARQEDIKAGTFGLVEICYVPKTPPPPWPQVGFCPVVIKTHMAKERDVQAALRDINRKAFVSEPATLIRVEGRDE